MSSHTGVIWASYAVYASCNDVIRAVRVSVGTVTIRTICNGYVMSLYASPVTAIDSIFFDRASVVTVVISENKQKKSPPTIDAIKRIK